MNRYTQLSGSKFSPLSLQEQMMVPLAKQKAHDNALNDIAQGSLFNVKNLEVDNDLVNQEIGQLKSQFQNIEDEILSKGVGSDTTKKLINLKRQREQALSAQGNLGMAQSAYDAYLKNKDMIMRNNRISSADKELYLQKALNDYKGVTQGPYSDYYGADTIDYNDKADKIASRMKPQQIRQILASKGIYRDTTELTEDEIAKVVYQQMMNDREVTSYGEAIRDASGGSINMEQAFQNAALNAAAKYKRGDYKATLLPGMGGPSSSKPKEQKDGVGFLQSPDKVAATKYIPDPGFFSNLSYTQSFDKFVSKQEEIINNENLPDSERLQAQKNLRNAKQTMRVAHKEVSKTLKLDSLDWDRLVTYDPEVLNQGNYTLKGDNSKLESSQIASAIEEGTFGGNGDFVVQRDRDTGNYNIFELPKEGGNLQINRIYRGTIKSDIYETKLQPYNEELQRVLENSAIIPYKNLNFTTDGTAESNRLTNAIEGDFVKYMKNSTIDMREVNEEDKELLESFKKYGSIDGAKFIGFTISKGTGELFANIEVNVPEDMKDKVKDNLINLPLSKLDENGQIPTVLESVLNRMEKQGTAVTKQAIGEIRATMALRNVVADENYNYDNLVKFNPIQTREYKKSLNILNKQKDSKLLRKLRDADEVRLFTNKKFRENVFNAGTTEESKYVEEVPEGYTGLSYKKGDEVETLTIGEYFNNLVTTTGRTKQELMQHLGNSILNGQFFLLENGAPTVEYINKNIDKIFGMPLLTKDKQDLIDF